MLFTLNRKKIEKKIVDAIWYTNIVSAMLSTPLKTRKYQFSIPFWSNLSRKSKKLTNATHISQNLSPFFKSSFSPNECRWDIGAGTILHFQNSQKNMCMFRFAITLLLPGCYHPYEWKDLPLLPSHHKNKKH